MESVYDDETDNHFDVKEEMDSGVVITDSGSRGYSVKADGNFLETTNDFDTAMEIALKWMKDNNFWPNLFYVNDHGNISMLDHKGNEIRSWV